MPSELRTPKTLADWLELDYFRRPSLLRRLWTPLLAVTFLAALAGVGWTFLPGRQTAYVAGRLSSAHAMFNTDCGQCHTGSFQTLNRLVRANAAIRAVPDSACTRCHGGPIHHVTQTEQRSCTSCHREHRGHSALARVPDGQCTSCHADLTRNDGAKPEYVRHVTGFTAGRHPEFRLWWRDPNDPDSAAETGTPHDPGHIRFNHKVHLDGVLVVDRKQLALQQEEVRKRGGNPCAVDVSGELKKTVKLECRTCHEVDEAGRYMKPINYERHCRECHPLSVQLAGEWADARARDLACDFSKTPAPHPGPTETAEMVRAALRARLSDFILRHGKTILGGQAPDEPARPIPGSPGPPPLAREQWDWVNRQLPQIERALFDGPGGCLYCHSKQPGAPDNPEAPPSYQLSSIPSRWYNHSVFRHDSHRMLACEQCHADARASTEARQVLLPRIETCRQCHNPQAGARSDCVECHLYHDRGVKDFRGTQTIDTLTRR